MKNEDASKGKFVDDEATILDIDIIICPAKGGEAPCACGGKGKRCESYVGGNHRIVRHIH